MVHYANSASHAIYAEVDPLLERQLTQADEGQLVEAVLFLRSSGDAQLGALLARVRAAEPAGAIATNYMLRLGALIVLARPAIVRRLITQPEVEFASANREGAQVCSNASC